MNNPEVPAIVLTADEVGDIVDYLDYGPVRDKLWAFLKNCDVVQYLENNK